MTGGLLSFDTRKLGKLFIILLFLAGACSYSPVVMHDNSASGELSGVSRAVALQEGGDSTATAWIEYPHDGQILPKEVTTFWIIAADVNGVGGVNAEINGVGLPASSMTDLSTNGSSSLVRMEVLWNPPGEGEYTLTASAGGGSTSVTFCVVNCEGVSEEEATPTDTPTPAPGATQTWTPIAQKTSTPTRTPTRTATWTRTAVPQGEIYFWADPTAVDAGGCTTIHWQATGAKSVKLDGSAVGTSGSATDCLCYSRTYNLTVVTASNTTEYRSVSVSVNGYCTSPVTDTPIPPPADTTPPVMSNLTLVWEGCSAYVQANISDPAGVSFAQGGLNNNGAGWGWIWMQNIGGELWQSEYPFVISDGMTTPVGTIEFQVRSGDNLGNQGNSTVMTHPYNGCGT